MRSSRWLALPVAAFSLIFVTGGAATSKQTLPIRVVEAKGVDTISVKQQRQLRSLSRKVASAQVATWKCQLVLGETRIRASVSPWALPPSVPYRTWVRGRWGGRSAACEERRRQRLIPLTNDWVTAVRLVQRIYPGTESWLLYISHREGGYGRFKMNYQGSGAGGWMQFMASTFYGYDDAAFADARRKGFVVSSSADSWTHPLGQALTAGYMRFTGRDGCHWCL